MVERDFVARLTIERAKLALDDARQRLAAVEEKVRANEAASAATLAARQRRRAKVQQDLDRTEQSLGALQLRAPSAGIVSLMTNYNSGGMMGPAQDFREGDSAWSGGGIVELPDLSSVLLTARLEESDRSRVDVGQPAVVRADAVPDREYAAKVAAISILARVDFTSGWPPSRDFDVEAGHGGRRPEAPAGHERGCPHQRGQARGCAPGAGRGVVARQRPADGLPACGGGLRRTGRRGGSAGQGTGGDRQGRGGGRSPRPEEAAGDGHPRRSSDRGRTMTVTRRIWGFGAVVAVIGAVVAAVAFVPQARAAGGVPTARSSRTTLRLDVYANGELRAGRSASLSAPPAGGACDCSTWWKPGWPCAPATSSMEFDPADQQYLLDQAQSELAEAEQEIVKMKADLAVQAAQDQVDLLNARFDVRRAELDARSPANLIGANEAKKRQLTVEEAKRRLAQLETI